MDNQQLAHDLAIAKLCGSDLETNKLVEKYRQYCNEINDYLKSQAPPNRATAIQNPFRG